LVIFVLVQLAVVLVVCFSIFFAVEFDDEFALPLALAAGLAIAVVDVLILAGVIGQGWPISAKSSTELLVAALAAVALLAVSYGVDDMEDAPVGIGIAGLLFFGLVEGLLLAGVLWPQHHLTAGPPTPTVTAASGHVPTPTVTITRTVTAAPGHAPTPTVTITRTVTAAPGHAPTPTVTATNPTLAFRHLTSGEVTAAIALVAAGGAVLGGLGTFLGGWVTFSERGKRSEKTEEPPA
jgi:hypothetical protein